MLDPDPESINRDPDPGFLLSLLQFLTFSIAIRRVRDVVKGNFPVILSDPYNWFVL
jgi:hypothetical protein